LRITAPLSKGAQAPFPIILMDNHA